MCSTRTAVCAACTVTRPEQASYKLSNKLMGLIMTGNISKLRHLVLLCAAFDVAPVDFGSITSSDRLGVRHLHTPSAPGICKPASAQRIPLENKNTG